MESGADLGRGRRLPWRTPCPPSPSSLAPATRPWQAPHTPCHGAPRGPQTRFLSWPEARTSYRMEPLAQLFAPLPSLLQKLLIWHQLWVGQF